MTGILPDVNIEGHFKILLRLLQQDHRTEFWAHLNLRTPTFGQLGLAADTADLVVWQTCQRECLILLTANRNLEAEDSLEASVIVEARGSAPLRLHAPGGRTRPFS